MPQRRRGAVAQPGNAAADAPSAAASGPRVLKKYPNRRLYDTRSSSYITLADVKEMVLEVEDFEVRDAKTGEDLTRSILLQIILDEESGGVPMFSAQMLAQIIRFYGHAAQGIMGTLLEKNLQTFVDLQKRLTPPLGDGQAPSADAWAKLVAGQGGAMQGLMSAYLDQSKAMFTQMQEQMARQAESLFPGFPPKKR